jgi:hypothetical protein
MATKNTEKFLEQLNTYVGEQVRSKLNTFYTIVTMTNKSLGEGFKEGYQDVIYRNRCYGSQHGYGPC